MKTLDTEAVILLVCLIVSDGTAYLNPFRPPALKKPKANRRIIPARTEKMNQQRASLPPPPPEPEGLKFPDMDLPEVDMGDLNPITPSAWNTVTSAVLNFATSLAPKQYNRPPSDRAARISVNRLPPDSIKVDLTDVPVIGKALSGVYAKVEESAVKSTPAITIASPKDKLDAIQTAADTGNLQFGLMGLLSTTLDIQLGPNQPGVAPIEIKSPLIPKWPFGRRKSEWNRVTNVGDGEIYFFNSKTGETQMEEPKHYI